MEQIANPYKLYGSLEKAMSVLRFPQLYYPAVYPFKQIRTIAVIGEKVLEIQWRNGVTYRVAQGTEDISGDYKEYPVIQKPEIGGCQVTVKGRPYAILLLTWHNDAYTFAISIPNGLEPYNVEGLVKAVVPLGGDSLPNPMVQYDHIFEAENAVGFSIEVPTNIHDKALQAIYVIDNKVVDIVYGDGITYRMAAGVSDISGSFTDYPVNDSFSLGRFHVTARGDKEHYYVAVWNDGKFSYALDTAHGLSRQQIEEFIKSLRVTN